MTDAQLCSDIVAWLREHAQGNENARPRRELLAHLCLMGHWSSPNATADRAMRKSCETLSQVGSCSRGYFLIRTPEDRRIAEGQLAAPAASMFDRKRRIEKDAPCGQLGLWRE